MRYAFAKSKVRSFHCVKKAGGCFVIVDLLIGDVIVYILPTSYHVSLQILLVLQSITRSLVKYRLAGHIACMKVSLFWRYGEAVD